MALLTPATPTRSERIAVAIACFDQGHYLPEAIASALAQTRPADELIVVDDGSTDVTADVARAYQEVRYVWQANAGLSAARNKALSITQAGRILFLDADDVLLPTALAEAERSLGASANLAFAYGGYLSVDDRRHVIDRHAPTPSAAPFLDLLRGNFIAMHGTVLYDAALLRASGGFDVGLRSCEDYDVYLRLTRSHPIGMYETSGAEYRRHGQGLSTNALRMIATSRTVIRRHARPVWADPESRAAATAGMRFMTECYARVLFDTLCRGSAKRFPVVARRVMGEAWQHPSAIGPALGALAGLSLRKIGRRWRPR